MNNTTMPNPVNIEVDQKDLAHVIAAQRLVRENLEGNEIPLGVMAGIALRSTNAHLLANEVLATVTGRDFGLAGPGGS